MSYKSGFKSGFVAIAGLPNAGKSTLLNNLIGEKLSIVSPRPQTTRLRTRGVYHSTRGQIVFVDTPGFYKTFDKLGEYLVNSTKNALKDCDLLLFLLDANSFIQDKNRGMLTEDLKKLINSVKYPKILFLNKVDLLKEKELSLVVEELKSWIDFDCVLSGSALYGSGLKELIKAVFDFLPEAPAYYPPEMATDQPLETRVSEIIREKVFHLTEKEVPYSIAVQIEDWNEDKEKRLVKIKASLFVERDSQKGIIIGQGGAKLKEIGTLARKDIEAILEEKVYLELRVKVKKKWRKDERFIERMYQ